MTLGIFGPAFWLGLWHGWKRRKKRQSTGRPSVDGDQAAK